MDIKCGVSFRNRGKTALWVKALAAKFVNMGAIQNLQGEKHSCKLSSDLYTHAVTYMHPHTYTHTNEGGNENRSGRNK